MSKSSRIREYILGGVARRCAGFYAFESDACEYQITIGLQLLHTAPPWSLLHFHKHSSEIGRSATSPWNVKAQRQKPEHDAFEEHTRPTEDSAVNHP